MEFEYDNLIGILDNEFPIKQKIGKGGTSNVYLSYLTENENNYLSRQSTGDFLNEQEKCATKHPIPVAVKVLLKNSGNDYERFLMREYGALERINHPNIIKPFRIGKGTMVSHKGVVYKATYFPQDLISNLRNGNGLTNVCFWTASKNNNDFCLIINIKLIIALKYCF